MRVRRGASGERWLRRRALVCVGLAIAVGLGALVDAELAAIARAEATRADASRAQAELHETRADVARLGAEWEALLAELDRTGSELEDGNMDRAAAGTELSDADGVQAAAAAQLGAIRAQLEEAQLAVAQAQGDAEAGAALADSLSVCLTGVSQLLNQLSVGDDLGALGTVGRIRQACGAVGVAVGA